MIGLNFKELEKVIFDNFIEILKLEYQKAKLKYEGGQNELRENHR